MESLIHPTFLSQVEFRLLSQNDLPALEWNGEYRHFRRLYSDVYQSTSQGRALMWVADLHGVGVIGQVFVQLNSARKELADGEARAYLYSFRIQPPHRRFGIGGGLLQVVEADLLRRGFGITTLNVGRQNLDARRFYERHGYRVIADEPGRWSYLDDQGNRHEVHEPAWRMEKLLGIP
jgi:GNAT superfamily N-acetyltransferase